MLLLGGSTLATPQAKAEVLRHYRKFYQKAEKCEKSRIPNTIIETNTLDMTDIATGWTICTCFSERAARYRLN